MDLPPPPPPAAPPPPDPGLPSWAHPGPPAWAPPPQASSRRWIFVVAGVALVAVVVAALFVVGRKTSTPEPTGSSPAAATFTDPAHHFSAAFRDQPVEDDQNLNIGGEQVPEVLWSDSVTTDVGEVVGYATYPADFTFDAPNAALAGSVNGEVSNSHGTLVSKTFGMYQGFHSVDAIIAAHGGYIETRGVLAGRTLFLVIVTSMNNPPEMFPGFANSLHVLDHAG